MASPRTRQRLRRCLGGLLSQRGSSASHLGMNGRCCYLFLAHLSKVFAPVFAHRKARVISPLPPPNYPPSPEQPDSVPVGTETVDEAEESCQQDQTEDISIQGMPASTAVDETHSPSVLQALASLNQEAIGETSSTVIPRPKPKVNGFILLTLFLISLTPTPASSSLVLLCPNFSSSLIDYRACSFFSNRAKNLLRTWRLRSALLGND